MMAPLIGISCSLDHVNGTAYARVSRDYAQALAMCGGTGVVLPVMPDAAMAAAYMDRLDGLLLSGGPEAVQPQNYGERAYKGVARISPERDVWEFALFEAALAQGKPVLGICRGCHIINVALGGSLYQDMRAQVEQASEHNPSETSRASLFHAVRFEEGSMLHAIFETSSLMVNSLHNQGIKDVAAPLRASARAEDGIIEGIESVQLPYVVGVQWHPEALVGRHPHFSKLFRSLVQAVTSGKENGSSRTGTDGI